MSTNLQRVGTALLDMDGIATQLHIKGVLYDINNDTGEEQYSPFISLEDIKNAGTTNALIQTIGKRGNAAVPINRLALAYQPDGLELEDVDRETIKNAHMLNNHTDDYFYTATAGAAVESAIAKIMANFYKEIQDLRAQNNFLLNSLAKQGVIGQYRPWAGYYDTFRSYYPVHQQTYLATAFVDSQVQNMMRVKEEEIESFSADDYVVVVNGDNINSPSDRKLLKIESITGTTMKFNGYSGFAIKAEQAHVYRSLGTSYKNTFSFGSFEESHASEKEIYTCLDDDNFRTRRKIKAAHTGYATTFRINPNRADGKTEYYLANIEIAAKKVGSPGALKCYVINAAYIDQFVDPAQARDEGLILAESQPFTMESKAGETIVAFDFSDNGQYPMLKNIDMGIELDSGRTRFCMIVEALEADSNNYYEVLFLQHYDEETKVLTDLQLNNICYEYKESGDSTAQAADNFNSLITSATINNADMFYGVTLKPVESSKFIPNDEGLYSTEFKTYEPIKVGHARLTMRVAREGMFSVVSTSADQTNDVTDGGTIKFAEDATYRVDSEKTTVLNGFSVLANADDDHNRLIVVGSNIREINHVDGDKIVIKKGAHIVPGDAIYPLSYTAFLRCSNKQWNATTQKYEQIGKAVKVKLNNVSIQPFYTEEERALMVKKYSDTKTDEIVKSRVRDQLKVSDNIIFEADLGGAEYNNFQLQVYWLSMANKASESFAGRIYDLSVSLDRVII